MLSALYESAQAAYREIDILAAAHGPWRVSDYLEEPVEYLPSAASLSLSAITEVAGVLAALDNPVRAALVDFYTPGTSCDASNAWLRRQYPQASRPAVAAPHQWHQDGGFGFDFLNQDPAGDGAILPMVTLWLPLTGCGELAPGIELLNQPMDRLLHPKQLSAEQVDLCWPAGKRWRPQMQRGDVLLIPGDTLHRTYVSEAMCEERLSIELRFLPRRFESPRLAGHCLLDANF